MEEEIEIGREIRSETIDEYESYTKEKCNHIKPTLDNWINYWELNKIKYPKLYELSMKYVCYLGSSCSSERTFSTSGGTYTQKRSRLLPYHLEELCVLHSYIKSEGIKIFENILFTKK